VFFFFFFFSGSIFFFQVKKEKLHLRWFRQHRGNELRVLNKTLAKRHK